MRGAVVAVLVFVFAWVVMFVATGCERGGLVGCGLTGGWDNDSAVVADR